MDDAKQAARRLAETYADRDDPNGWFEEFYARAGGNIENVYWADLEPGPCLMSWLAQHPVEGKPRAVVVGCGLGDDAEALVRCGYRVTAFDISPAAVTMCRQRYPDSTVEYVVADLLAMPAGWAHGFDLVYECNTIQALVGDLRGRARDVIADLVAPGGVALVSCRSREPGEKENEFPVPMDRDEIDGFRRAGLIEDHFDAYDDAQTPPVPHFFAVYRRP